MLSGEPFYGESSFLMYRMDVLEASWAVSDAGCVITRSP